MGKNFEDRVIKTLGLGLFDLDELDFEGENFYKHVMDVAKSGNYLEIIKFCERLCAEGEGRTRWRPDGISQIGPQIHLLHAIERLYLALGLDKAFPVQQDIKISQIEVCDHQIPESFDGFRIMWLSDLHLDVGRTQQTVRAICDAVRGQKPDLLAYGGDYRHGHNRTLSIAEASIFQDMREIHETARAQRVIGLLGNHDLSEMMPSMKAAGITPMVNDYFDITKGRDRIRFVALDDSYRYFHPFTHFCLSRGVDPKAFTVVLSHSPQTAPLAAEYGADLFLTGHTHAGQFRWPFLQRIQKKFFGMTQERLAGEWELKGMRGYTSSGIGSSALPIRNIPSEVLMVTLRSGPR